MEIRELSSDDKEQWAELRLQLWPEENASQHSKEIERMLSQKELVSFGAFSDQRLVGLVELSLRNIVDGCLSSPVVYLEGWVVRQDHRGKGIGRHLIEHSKAWGRSQGCKEMGSDTEVTREDSIRAHRKLGFEEVDRVVNFRMNL